MHQSINPPECWLCGTLKGIREVSHGGPYGLPPTYVCSDCYTEPQIDYEAGVYSDGPAFDDLQIAKKDAP